MALSKSFVRFLDSVDPAVCMHASFGTGRRTVKLAGQEMQVTKRGHVSGDRGDHHWLIAQGPRGETLVGVCDVRQDIDQRQGSKEMRDLPSVSLTLLPRGLNVNQA